MTTGTQADRAPAGLTVPEERLWTVYTTALDRFDRLRDGLVSRSLVRFPDEWRLTEPSPLNTAEVLRALFALERTGIGHDWSEPRALLQRLVNHPACSDDVQVVSLALWAAAAGQDDAADELFARLERHTRSGFSQSMVLGWAISALCEYGRMEGRADRAHTLAQSLVRKLAANQNPTSGLFHASNRRHGLLRRPVAETTLSSQTYAILGIAAYVIATGDRLWLPTAAKCAGAVVARQGTEGQWWWRYDARDGSVAHPYPVYSVNQDSAVPLALRTLGRALGENRYDAQVRRGLDWELAAPEVGRSLIQPGDDGVARSVEQGEGGGFVVDDELYSYQPARFIGAALSANALAA